MGWLADRRQQKAELEQRERADAAAREALKVHEQLEAARLPFAETNPPGVVLKAGEVVHMMASGAHLIEPRREPGTWQGGSRGVSVRVAKGVSYRTSGSRGTYVQGAEMPTPVDEGTFVVTDRRCIFIGTKRSTEWVFSKLLGFSLEGEGVAFFNVSNRQKTTGVYYGDEFEDRLDATISAAIARARSEDDHARVVAELQDEYRDAYRRWETINAGGPSSSTALPSG